MLSSWRMYEMHLALFLKAGCDSNVPAPLALGLLLFLSNLQVSQLLIFTILYWQISFFCLSVHDHRILLAVYLPN
jgi:hypothetical protein